MSNSLPLFQVDAFTTEAFTGNPAGVCITDGPKSEDWMVKVAAEVNVSETAFVHKLPEKGDNWFALRWFTPTEEIDICGHGTLSTTHILWTENIVKAGTTLHFMTKSGELIAQQGPEGSILLDFPRQEGVTVQNTPGGLAEAIGINESQIKGIVKNDLYHVVELDSEDTIRKLKPNYGKLYEVEEILALCVTAPATLSPGADYAYRLFEPRLGVNEDHVCGSANCCSGPYWQAKMNKSEFKARSVSKRGGTVHVQMKEDRVFLGGHAVTSFRGTLHW